MGLHILFAFVISLPAEWRGFHHDLCHTGYQPELKGCLTPDSARIKWQSADHGFSSFAVVDINGDSITEIISGNFYDYKVYAFNGKNGTILWSYLTGSTIWAVPAIADIDNDNKLEAVVGSDDGKMYALNGEDGSLLWNYTTKAQIFAAASIADVDNDTKPEVVFGALDSFIYALNGEDGSILWSYGAKDWILSTPAIADIDNDTLLEVVVYAGSYMAPGDSSVYALNGEDGSLLWSYKTSGGMWSSPAIADLNNDASLEVVFGSFSGVYALNGNNGSVFWSCPTLGSVSCSPAIADIDNDSKPEIAIGSDNSFMYALNGEDGSILWSYATGGSIGFSPAIGDIDYDNKLEVVFASYDTILYALNGENGGLSWKFGNTDAGDCRPSIADVDNDSLLEVVFGGTGIMKILDGECAAGTEENKPSGTTRFEINCRSKGEVTFKYYIPEETNVRLKIYDITGAVAATIINSRQGKGEHIASWKTQKPGSGVYLVRLSAGETGQTKKIVIIK